MSKNKSLIIIIFVVVAAIVALQTFFTVHQTQQAVFTALEVGEHGACMCFSADGLFVHPIQQLGLGVDGKLRLERRVLNGPDVPKRGLFHARFEFTPRQREQVEQGGFVDQESNHLQPHGGFQRPVPFEGIAP